jgi:hypothetical protein
MLEVLEVLEEHLEVRVLVHLEALLVLEAL